MDVTVENRAKQTLSTQSHGLLLPPFPNDRLHILPTFQNLQQKLQATFLQLRLFFFLCVLHGAVHLLESAIMDWIFNIYFYFPSKSAPWNQ